MRVFCELTEIYVKKDRETWWKEQLVDNLLRHIESAGLPFEMNAYMDNTRQKRNIDKKTSIKTLMANQANITFYPSISDNYPSFLFDHDENSFRLLVTVEAETLGAAAAWFIRFIASVNVQWADHVWLGPVMNICVDMPMPSFRPEQLHHILTMQSSWDIFSYRTLNELQDHGLVDKREQYLQEFDSFKTAKLPIGVERTWIDDDLLVIKWVGDEAREIDIRNGVILRAKWLRQHIALKRSSHYNELGDLMVSIYGFDEHPDVTFYSTAGIAYQTALFIDGRIEPKIVANWETWLKRGQLPDGSELNSFDIIMPNRKAAISVRAQLTKIGVDRVLYVGEHGSFWNTHPEGDWIEDENE